MAILESLKRFATGKNSAERAREIEVNKSIRHEANEAALVVRRQQSIKFAEEREKTFTEKESLTHDIFMLHLHEAFPPEL